MATTSVTETKVNAKSSSLGEHGEKFLACGSHIGMRLWEDEQPGEPKEPSQRDYETVGFVLKGRAELHLNGGVIPLNPGDSWIVPKGAHHTYKILETFSAIEATCPPAQKEGSRH
ncbi:MAG TPA: cupin domain-containing protein [Myxococcaceae bacterium]|nr:cupin domain-containing protein [Myxococcaceae bacterium]